MNQTTQVTRAGPTLAGGSAVKSTLRKDLPPSTSFAAVLGSELDKQRQCAEEIPPRVEREHEPEKPPKAVEDDRCEQRDPSQVAAAAGQAKTAETSQPPLDHAEKDTSAEPTGEAGPVQSTSSGQVSGSPAAAQSLQAGAAQKAQAVLAGQAAAVAGQVAAPAQAAADDNPAAVQDNLQLSPQATQAAQQAAQPHAANAELAPAAASTPSAKLAAGAVTQGSFAEDLARQLTSEMKMGGAAPSAADKADNNPANRENGAETRSSADRQAGSHVAKTTDAASPGSGTAAQVVVEGNKQTSSTNPIFEPARLAEAQTKDSVWQICRNVESMLKNRQPALRMVLYPEELGRIDLRLTSSSSGMGISVVAEQASTARLLEAQLTQLRQALTDAGVQLAQLSVNQQNSQAAGSYSQQQSRRSQPDRSHPSQMTPVTVESRRSNNPESTDVVDYRV